MELEQEHSHARQNLHRHHVILSMYSITQPALHVETFGGNIFCVEVTLLLCVLMCTVRNWQNFNLNQEPKICILMM